MKRAVHFAALFCMVCVLSACGGKNTDPGTIPPTGSGNGSSDTSTDSGTGTGASGHFLDIYRFPVELLISGGVSKDGIPALTDPNFVDLNSASANYLDDDDLVLGVFINNIAKAYPHNIGWHHEIVNDVIGEQAIVVTFCPLTGSGLVFDAQSDGSGGRVEMGVSGLLFNNNLVMYDRRDNSSLFPQMIYTGVTGVRTGNELRLLPVIETTWGYWKRLFPTTQVISGNGPGTYNISRYRSYPYAGYLELNSGPLFPLFPEPQKNPTHNLYPPKEMALGIRFGQMTKAYPFSNLGGNEGVVNDTVADNPIVVFYYAEEKLALAYSRRFGSQVFTFEKIPSTDARFPFLLRDRETGSTWNLLGQGVAGEMKGRLLQHLPAHNAFWFAWATFWQNTEIYTP